MASLGISELQFAFTYLHHYLNLPGNEGLNFLIPTPREEGNPEKLFGGTDLVLQGNIFIQFKVTKLMIETGANEVLKGRLTEDYLPFFRFNIKNNILSGKPASGQYDMLRRLSQRRGFIVKYVVPAFNAATYSHRRSVANWWYTPFRTLLPANAIQNFTFEIHIRDVIASTVIIENSDDHRICFNYDDLFNRRPIHVFSEKGNLEAKLGVQEYDFKRERFLFQESIHGISFEETIQAVAEDLEFPREEEQSFRKIQNALIQIHDIFWIPIFRNKPKLVRHRLSQMK